MFETTYNTNTGLYFETKWRALFLGREEIRVYLLQMGKIQFIKQSLENWNSTITRPVIACGGIPTTAAVLHLRRDLIILNTSSSQSKGTSIVYIL